MGLYDRDYMREPREPQHTPPKGSHLVTILVIIIVLSLLLSAIL